MENLNNIAGFGVCGKGEAKRYLEQTLKEFKRLCDKTYIVCNNCGKAERDLILKYGFEIIEDNREWGKQQWKIKEEAIKQIKADWFLVLDMDETFDKNFNRAELENLCVKGGTGYYFYLVNLYEKGYSKKWSFWNVRLFNGSYCRDWEKKPLHCGLAPRIAYVWGNYAPFIVKHYGLKEKKDRDKKVKRYEQYDPKAQFKDRAYYDFLSSKEDVIEFNEDELSLKVKQEVKNYHHKIPKKMKEEKKKFYFVKNPAGKIVDIEENYLLETLAREGFELMSKDAVVKGGSGVKTPVSSKDVEEKTIEIKDEKITETQDIEEKVVEVADELTCEVCGFVAKTKAGLKAHSKKHK